MSTHMFFKEPNLFKQFDPISKHLFYSNEANCASYRIKALQCIQTRDMHATTKVAQCCIAETTASQHWAIFVEVKREKGVFSVFSTLNNHKCLARLLVHLKEEYGILL